MSVSPCDFDLIISLPHGAFHQSCRSCSPIEYLKLSHALFDKHVKPIDPDPAFVRELADLLQHKSIERLVGKLL